MKSGNRSTWQRVFYSPAGIVVGCVVFILLIRGGLSIHEKADMAEQRLQQAQIELAGLERQQQTLSSSIDQLSTPEGIEAELREKYHAVKQGESVAVIIGSSSGDDVDSEGALSSSSLASSTSPSSWWGSVLRSIGF
jgi:cell division protein FtsB